MSFATREEWLQKATQHLRAAVEGAGLALPETIHVSVGFPSVHALRAAKQRIGECWAAKCSADGNPQIYVSPLIADGARVLDVLLHELIHATGIGGHRASFKRPAVALGLTGKMTATEVTPELQGRLKRPDLRNTRQLPAPAPIAVRERAEEAKHADAQGRVCRMRRNHPHEPQGSRRSWHADVRMRRSV